MKNKRIEKFKGTFVKFNFFIENHNGIEILNFIPEKITMTSKMNGKHEFFMPFFKNL